MTNLDQRTLDTHCAVLSHEDAQRVRGIVRAFPHSNNVFVRLLVASEDARKACETGDGVFVFALASAHVMRGDLDVMRGMLRIPKKPGPLRWLVRRMGSKREETLQWLKLPATRASLRILRKIPVDECTPEVLAGLALVLMLPSHKKALQHVPVVRAAHGLVLPHLFFSATPTLIHELAKVEGLDAARDLAERARQLNDDMRETEYEEESFKLHSLAAFKHLSEEINARKLALAQALQGRNRISTVSLREEEQDFATPLVTLAEMQAEGEKMRHCIGSVALLRKAAEGHLCAWSIQCADGRYTVAISKTKNGSWTVHDVKGFANAEPPAWLEEWADTLALRANLEHLKMILQNADEVEGSAQ